MDFDKLAPVEDLKSIKGILYPADVGFRSLIVTGPPGAGKTTRVETLGGWPGELFLDLTRGNWWRDRTLTVRPREVHLGLPFVGHREGLALFEEAEQETSELVFEPQRLRLPPPRRWFNPVDWRRKFVLEFLLPSPERVLEVRELRAVARTHAVDQALYLEQIRHQLDIYCRVAEILHRAGMRVIVRTGFESEPLAFRWRPSPGEESSPVRTDSRRRVFERVVGRLVGNRPDTALQELTRVHLKAEGVTISPGVLPVELRQGGLRLQLHRARSVLPGGDERSALILINPDECSRGIHGLVRIPRGARARMTHAVSSHGTSLPLPPESRLKLEVANSRKGILITDLHSDRGTEVEALTGGAADLLAVQSRDNLQRVTATLGNPIRASSPVEVAKMLAAVNERLALGRWRPSDREGAPGGLVELPQEIRPVLIGDLHANVDNLLKILCVNGFLAEIEAGTAALIFLGDAVHPEETSQLEEMDGSLLMMDLILRLMNAFPDQVLYLRGNHDSFSSDLTKDGVPQGRLWRRRMDEVWGPEIRREFKRFYSLCPAMVASDDFVACHAGPPQGSVSRAKLINLGEHPRLEHQITWSRVKGPGHPAGYGKHDVKALKAALGLSPKAVMIVSHNPARDGESVWLNAGGIKRHHVVYSAGRDELAVFTRLRQWMRPLVYRAEPMLEALSAEPAVRD